ncbi:hypothetical protein [Shewanella sp. NIFS-20-20]|uniref:hypothetical protein n=1 Tax=Shewanella sp. NIFS-20-20 TaxID=2853806 RepID=UPI001C446E8F|nr:hypothetical protein [Shewanella sp. NIFS-20-20]MBV7314491.1 hypothetical protein [Shewanella sp. NIFS-20-20]
MTCKQAKLANIIVALLFAAAMLLTAYLVADKDMSKHLSFSLIMLWLVPFLYFSKKSQPYQR